MSDDGRREVAGLGPAHWPLFAGYGSAVTRRSATLAFPWQTLGGGDPPDLATALADRFDALDLEVVALPGLQVPVLRAGSSVRWSPEDDRGPANAAVLREHRGEPGWLELAVPDALVDTDSWELIWSWLREGGGPAVSEALGVLDVLQWQHEEAERTRPGGYSSALRAMLDVRSAAGEVGYAWHPCGTELLRMAADVPGDLGDVLTAALALAVLDVGTEAAAVSRVLDGRFMAELRPVVGRLSVLAPVRLDVALTAAADELLAEVARATAEARAGYARNVVDAAGDMIEEVRRRSPGRPLLAVAPGVVLAPVVAGNDRLRPTVTGDDPGPADLLLRYVTDGPDAGVALRYAVGTTVADPVLLEERLGVVLRRLAGTGRPAGPPPRVGPRERAWLRRRLTGEGLSGSLRAVHDAIGDQAKVAPTRVAIEATDRSVTYGELLTAVTRTARRLSEAGVEEGDVVAVDADRLGPFVVGSLAALRCGAAFAPIDPAVPARRRERLIRRASARVVLSGSTGADDRWGDVAVLAVQDGDGSALDQAEAGGAGVEGVPDALAYVVFTSGSTGSPNPVGVGARAFASYVRAAADRFGIGPTTRAASPAIVTADLPYTTLWPTLASGGTVVEIDSRSRTDAESFAAVMAANRVEVLKITPSHLSALLDTAAAANCLPSRLLVFGGERLAASLVERVRTLRPGLEIANHYGPTEATVGVLAGRLPVERRQRDAPAALPHDPPLGDPLAHVELSVVDADGCPVPVGHPGELVIGSSALAFGYLGEPRLTAQRFRPDPTGVRGGRVYRTGDRVRVDADGGIAYLGRRDDQVKVRGWRIDLAEVEHVLREHPGVTRACVVDLDTANGAVLVGFAVGDDRLTEAVLHDHLAARLPDAWVPSRLQMVADLPTLPNGKVDRQRLRDRTVGAGVVVSARDDVELVLAATWAELLGVPDVDVTLDLFRNGAHSLMAMQALTRLREMLGVPLRLENFFERPTIEGLAAHLVQGPDRETVVRRAAVAAKVLRMTETELDELGKQSQEMGRP